MTASSPASLLKARGVKVPIICAVNKADRLGRNIIPVLAEAGAMKGITEVFPISALTGEGVPELADHLGSLMPESPYLYPPGDTTDQPVGQLLAELIRSQALIRTRDEIPHSVEAKTVHPDDHPGRRPGGWSKPRSGSNRTHRRAS